MKLTRRKFIGLVSGAAAVYIAGIKAKVAPIIERYGSIQLIMEHGTGKEQTRRVTAYDESTATATFDLDWDLTPSKDSVYEILPGEEK